MTRREVFLQRSQSSLAFPPEQELPLCLTLFPWNLCCADHLVHFTSLVWLGLGCMWVVRRDVAVFCLPSGIGRASLTKLAVSRPLPTQKHVFCFLGGVTLAIRVCNFCEVKVRCRYCTGAGRLAVCRPVSFVTA